MNGSSYNSVAAVAATAVCNRIIGSSSSRISVVAALTITILILAIKHIKKEGKDNQMYNLLIRHTYKHCKYN